ncbi:MAG: phosphoribosylpyrophosphate synthetase [Candidatus Omnitrophota bacterium]|nr:MAG: phosphoribosylpyrophosphate synthetase [Candidatus Omnitrophota bacterium]
MHEKLTIFSGNANRKLAEDISSYLKIPLGKALVSKFSEGEIRVKIEQNVRGKDVFIIQPTCPPVNDNLMELLILIDALTRASAGRLTAVIPYYGYARQDRKDQPRVPITAKLVANLLTGGAGVDRVLTMDLHAGQIQGFFDIPVDHLFAAPVLIDYFKKLGTDDMVIVSPDVGAVKMARAFANRLNTPLCIVDKRRIDFQKIEVMNVLGDVKGKIAVIIDDMVATAGSLVEAVSALRKNGAKEVYAGVTHAVFSGPALERIRKSSLKEILITDTIIVNNLKACKKIKVLSVASLLGEAIKRIHNEESVSSLFV